MDKPSIILIHGGDSYANEAEFQAALKRYPPRYRENYVDWKGHLPLELASQFPLILSPQMPRKDDAKYADWAYTFEQVLQRPDLTKQLILIGHSLGGCFFLQYLSRHHSTTHQIKQLHLVASCLTEGDFKVQPNYELIRLNVEQIHVWHSEDDPIVPISQAYYITNNLKQSVLHSFSDRGHFNQPYFPELLTCLCTEE